MPTQTIVYMTCKTTGRSRAAARSLLMRVKALQSIWLLTVQNLLLQTLRHINLASHTKPSSMLKPKPTCQTRRIGQTRIALKASGSSGSLARAGRGLLLLFSGVSKRFSGVSVCVCVETQHQSRATHAIPETDFAQTRAQQKRPTPTSD